MTGHGGWPMTVFLTPDGAPFYGGTYFPPEDRHGLPGFPRCCRASPTPGATRRGEVVQSSARDRASRWASASGCGRAADAR